MSRILRRPMFRGGRVDSRGTGIASGLGYAKGGQVQPRQNFIWGGLAYVPQAFNAIRAFGPAAYRGFKAARAYTPWSKDLGKWGRVKDFFKPKGGLKITGGKAGEGVGFRTGSYLRQNPMTTLALGPQVVDKGYKAGEWAATEGLPAVGRTTADVLWPDDWPTWNPFKKEEEEKTTVEEKIDPELAAALAKIEERDALIKLMEEQARVKKNKKLTKEEKVAKIKENEAMFREVYGSGRGEDATAMLLNFAGKALKPEATVKSAFGEFFEEEGKRPSERKKYKDAAAQAAIQSYLAGEKTLAEVEAFKAKTGWQLGEQAALKKAANDPSNLDWTDRRTYYMTQIKGNNRDSGKVIRMSLQDEKSEKGKQIFETKDTEWITNPTEAAEMDDGLYIVTPKKGPKRIFEIKEGIVIDRSSDFPL